MIRPEILNNLFYNGMHTTTASSQYIVIGPAVEQFVTRLCIDI